MINVWVADEVRDRVTDIWVMKDGVAAVPLSQGSIVGLLNDAYGRIAELQSELSQKEIKGR